MSEDNKAATGNGSSQPAGAVKAPTAKRLPKRFYKDVAVKDEGGRAAILLDGRPVRTPGKAPLSVPSKKLAEAIAQEWRAQGDHIDPQTMPLTKLANSTIDGIEGHAGPIVDDIVRHARSDLLCYRASEPQGLVDQQAKHWDPVIAWAKDALNAPLTLADGIVHAAQADTSMVEIKKHLDAFDAFALAALHVMTSLTGSALLPLAVARKRLTPDEAWTAAHVDEDWQASKWGEDAEAKARRKTRRRDFDAACRTLALVDA